MLINHQIKKNNNIQSQTFCFNGLNFEAEELKLAKSYSLINIQDFNIEINIDIFY